jgi:glycosyltransferase involved in cell wall biosynthesis
MFMVKETGNSQTVSIALATYNGERYLEELLSSLQHQTVKPSELVILDDCSTDNSLKIINSFQFSFEKKVFSNEINRGPVYTFRKLASLSKGDFTAFCDQDDIWFPEKLELSLSNIRKIDEHTPGVVFSDLSLIDEEGKLIQPSFWKKWRIEPNKFSLTDILFGNVITGCTATINGAMKNELLIMPSDIIMHDHWIALIAYSFGKYCCIDQPTVLYRSHDKSVTGKENRSFLKTFLSDFVGRSEYLDENIHQAVKFKTMYESVLSRNDIKNLQKFIQLHGKTFFYKRSLRYIRSLLRKFR